MKEKIKNILVKIKNNKKKVIGITLGVFLTFIFTFTVYNMNNPTSLNRLFASIGSVPNEAFEDSDFYNCIVDEYNNEHQDNKKTYTDSLTDEELASITSLTCNYKSIESTNGIEKLTGLTSLKLPGADLTSIDLSSNTALTDLDLFENNLTNIDLSNNTALTTLVLSDNNLTNIDLSSNTALTDLGLFENNLTSIDVSKNVLLTELDLYKNQLTNIDLSNNVNLRELDLHSNRLTSVDLSSNTALTELDSYENNLTNIDLSNNAFLTYLDLSENRLANIDLSSNVNLTSIYLEKNQLEELNLNNNNLLETLGLSDNKLTNLDLSNNTNLSSLYIDGTPLIEDILMQNGDTYTIEEKIIPPSGQSFSYSIDDTSVASIQGNTITALKEGSTTLRTSFGNISFERKLAVGEVKLSPGKDTDVQINTEEKYIYFNDFDQDYFNTNLKDKIISNVGNTVRDGNSIKVLLGNKIIDEYKMVYFYGVTGESNNNDYRVVTASTEAPTKYNIDAVNCTYEFTNDGKEVIIKYNGNEIDRKKIVYMYLPKDYKISGLLQYFGNNILDDSIINNIDDVSKIDKNKVNILNAKMTYKTDDGNYFEIMDENERVSMYYPMYINSNNYDLTKEYIYLGTNDFNNDIQIYDDEHEKDNYMNINAKNNNKLTLEDDESLYYSWDLIKVTSDIYDMSGDVIDLKGEDIDISKINVTNANLKVDNNKLLVMYNDEVVKEFSLENVKKEDTITKPSNEEKNTTRVTTKENRTTITKKTTTKKKSIIDRIFGKSETTTKKEETTTTKKSVIVKKNNKTTKVVGSSDTINNNSKNSNNKIVTKSNILILLLGIMDIGLIVYIVINKKNIKL